MTCSHAQARCSLRCSQVPRDLSNFFSPLIYPVHSHCCSIHLMACFLFFFSVHIISRHCPALADHLAGKFLSAPSLQLRTLLRKHQELSSESTRKEASRTLIVDFTLYCVHLLCFLPCLSEYGQDDWMMPSVAELMANGSSDPRDFWTRKSSHAQCNEDHQKGACGCS